MLSELVVDEDMELLLWTTGTLSSESCDGLRISVLPAGEEGAASSTNATGCPTSSDNTNA